MLKGNRVMRQVTSSNRPLCGEKGTLLEGGIRMPFLMHWPNHLPARLVEDRSVSSLDIFTAAVNLASTKSEEKLDGVDLMPHLLKPGSSVIYEQLYSRVGSQAAFRSGDWKLYRPREANAEWELYNLRADMAEQKNLVSEQPIKLMELQLAWEKVDSQMVEPLWGGGLKKWTSRPRLKCQNDGCPRFLLPFPYPVRYPSSVRCHLKDWISIVLLVSFLRLQVVCCCGSVVHCVTDGRFANEDMRVVCHQSVGTEKQNLAKLVSERETAKKSNRSKCSCTKHHDKRDPNASKIEAAAKGGSINKPSPICGCGHRSCDEHAHHHLYWLSHESFVPQSKMGFHNAVLIQSFDRTFAFPAHHDDFKNRLENSLPSSAPPDLLSLLGHWRI